MTQPHIYAAGDAGGMPLTPVTVMEGRVVANNLLGHAPRIVDYRGLATVGYTIPPLASVGMSEAGTARRAVPRSSIARTPAPGIPRASG